MKYYSAEELCELYPEKYIAVKVIEKDSVSLDILKCQLLTKILPRFFDGEISIIFSSLE